MPSGGRERRITGLGRQRARRIIYYGAEETATCTSVEAGNGRDERMAASELGARKMKPDRAITFLFEATIEQLHGLTLRTKLARPV